MTIIRIGLGLQEHVHKRLVAITSKLDTSQTRLMSAVVSALSEVEINAILHRYDQITAIEEEIRSAADANMMAYLRGKSLEDLQRILVAAQTAGNPA